MRRFKLLGLALALLVGYAVLFLPLRRLAVYAPFLRPIYNTVYYPIRYLLADSSGYQRAARQAAEEGGYVFVELQTDSILANPLSWDIPELSGDLQTCTTGFSIHPRADAERFHTLSRGDAFAPVHRPLLVQDEETLEDHWELSLYDYRPLPYRSQVRDRYLAARRATAKHTIMAGRGCDIISLGMPFESVSRAWGAPDWADDAFRYFRARGVDIEVRDGTVAAIRFHFYSRDHQPFLGATDSGVRIRDSMKDVAAAYGDTERVPGTGAALGYEVYLRYPSRGVTFAFYCGRLARIVVYPRYDEPPLDVIRRRAGTLKSNVTVSECFQVLGLPPDKVHWLKASGPTNRMEYHYPLTHGGYLLLTIHHGAPGGQDLVFDCEFKSSGPQRTRPPNPRMQMDATSQSDGRDDG